MTILLQMISAQPLNVARDRIDLLIGHAGSDIAHHLVLIGLSASGAICLELIRDVSGLLPAKGRVEGGRVAVAAWTVTGHARRNT